MDWLGAIVLIGVIVGGLVLWEKLKEQESGAGSAARGVSSALGTTGRGLVRLYGVGLVVLGIFVVVIAGGSVGAILAGVAAAGYGVYLMFGGSWVVY